MGTSPLLFPEYKKNLVETSSGEEGSMSMYPKGPVSSKHPRSP